MEENTLLKARRTIDEADKEMAALFEKRFQAVRDVIAWKMANGKEILDSSREAEIKAKNLSYINDEELKPYYAALFDRELELSRQFQQEIRKKKNS